jgi:hypothetical protein
MMSFVDDLMRAMDKLDLAIAEVSNCQQKLVEVIEGHMILDPKNRAPSIPKVNLPALDKELKKQ